MKNAAIALGVLLLGGLSPVVPKDMNLLYSYQTYASIPQESSPTTTPRTRAWKDTDGDGLVSIAVFADKKGNKVEVEIPDTTYEEMGKRGGSKFNPKKDEYISVFESITPKTKAAVAVGTVTSAEVGSAAVSLTYAHNNDGNVLTVTVASLTGGAGPTTVTYNASLMTKEIAATDGTSEISILYSLATPSAGSNNVIVTYGGLRNFGSSATSYTGGDTADVIGATSRTTALTNDSTPTLNLTTAQDGSIVQDAVIIMAARTATVGASQTQRTNLQIVGDGYILSSTEPKATAGSVTMSWSLSSAANWTIANAEVRAGAAAAEAIVPKVFVPHSVY